MKKAFLEASYARPEGIDFRSIEDGDLPFLAALYASTRATELAPVPWPEEIKRQFLAQQFALQHKHYHQEYADADFLLIRHLGEPVGRIYVHRAAEEISVIDIALLPAYCGRGVGSALLAELLEEARLRKYAVTLYVEPNNPARRLYERLGFQLVENRGVYDFMRWQAIS